MYDHFGAFGIKVIKCKVYLKAVTYTSTDEVRFCSEQKNLWNMKYFCKRKNLQGAGKCIDKFWTYLNQQLIKPMQAV